MSVEISVVIPCFNEAENVAPIADAVIRELRSMDCSFEIIFIDNSSTDSTVEEIRRLCNANPAIRLIVNNQNYGQMRSPVHAIYQTIGDAVLGISADFQDPPGMIPALVSRWRQGTPIVLGVRRSERASWFLRFLRAIGYAFYARFGDYKVIPDATGFGIYDRAVIDCLKLWRDPEPFFRGLLVESGFQIETIAYDRPPRAAGQTKNNFWTLLNFALSGLASCSRNLLRLPLLIGVLVGILSVVTLLGAATLALLGHFNLPLSLVGIGEACFALQMVFIGLIGEQVRSISIIVRNTPLVVEKERVNF
jgi:glycosyltransferase involved in cell wall biosynthesis